ncbi:DASH complex subunit Dad1-domain-containing protein [Lentinula raphanica]|nr:DASH complex subunit Dad1-domain-containing protein [Lentinula raphanica]
MFKSLFMVHRTCWNFMGIADMCSHRTWRSRCTSAQGYCMQRAERSAASVRIRQSTATVTLFFHSCCDKMAQVEEEHFFARERDKLSREINSGFEELLSTTNGLNRKLEEVLGMTREYETVAALWRCFYHLMKQSDSPEGNITMEEKPPGLPGTGGHVIK